MIIPDRLQARHWNAFNQAVSTGTSRYGPGDMLSVPARTQDGRTISIDFTVALVTEGDSIGHIGAVIRDVTGGRQSTDARPASTGHCSRQSMSPPPQI
jgi:hypothetical protein